MHSNVMPRTSGPLHGFNGGGWELSPKSKNTFLHVGWMGGTPFHAYDKAANQDMYDFIILMLWPNVWKRAEVFGHLSPVLLSVLCKRVHSRTFD